MTKNYDALFRFLRRWQAIAPLLQEITPDSLRALAAELEQKDEELEDWLDRFVPRPSSDNPSQVRAAEFSWAGAQSPPNLYSPHTHVHGTTTALPTDLEAGTTASDPATSGNDRTFAAGLHRHGVPVAAPPGGTEGVATTLPRSDHGHAPHTHPEVALPYALATMSANQTIPLNSHTLLNFDDLLENVGGAVTFSATNKSFTVVTAGLYIVEAAILWSQGDSSYRSLHITPNIGDDHNAANALADPTNAITTVARLTAGTVLTCNAWQDDTMRATTIVYGRSITPIPIFSLCRIGG